MVQLKFNICEGNRQNGGNQSVMAGIKVLQKFKVSMSPKKNVYVYTVYSFLNPGRKGRQ